MFDRRFPPPIRPRGLIARLLGTARRPGLGRRPRAFTLLEVLLALGLSVVLLVAVGASVDLYRRLTTAAQADLSEARLVRAIIRKIEADIRSVVPPQAPPSNSSSATGGSSGTSSSGGSTQSGSAQSGGSSTAQSGNSGSQTSAPATDPINSVYSETVFGLCGNAQSLVLDTLCPHQLPAPQSSAAPSTQPQQPQLSAIHGDLKIVGYFLVGASGASMPATVQPIAQSAGPDGTPITSGLARLEGDRVAIGYSMERSASLAPSTRILAPEVVAITFRYFDGTAWLPTWDAEYLQALPQAVEVVLGIRSPDSKPAVSSPEEPAQPLVHVYRHVIPVSTAAPPMNIDATSGS